MAMPVRIVMYAPADSTARNAARAAFERVTALEATMSDYRLQSELRQVQDRAGQSVVISRELYDVLQRAVDIASRTDGAFDPTAAPLIALWRKARRTGRLPATSELNSARALVSWKRITLDSAKCAVLLSPGTKLDLGAIAKGFIIEQAMLVLKKQGIASAMIEAGGDIVVGSAPPGRSGWNVEVEGVPAEFAAHAAALTNAAIATSGPASQSVSIDGVRYSHVVDPRTGLALTNGLTAYVIAKDAATADALATAASVLGNSNGLAHLFPEVLIAIRNQMSTAGGAAAGR